ncbi:MAG: hypothetical protein ACKO9Q_14310, partial [Pirellula sp.]
YEDGGESAEQVFDKVRLKQPDVYVLPSLISPQVVEAVLGQIHKEHKHLVTRIVANDSVDALIQILKGNPKHAKALLGVAQGVLNQRLWETLATCPGIIGKEWAVDAPVLLRNQRLHPG